MPPAAPTPRLRTFWRSLTLLASLLAAMALIAGCDGDEDTPSASATTPPTATDLTPAASPTGTTTDGSDTAPYAMADRPIALELVAGNLTAPVDFAAPNDGSGRLFVVEQTGTIRVVGPDGRVLAEPFLDLADRLVKMSDGYTERGLLGLAFHPQYADHERFFVYYSAPLAEGAPERWDHTSHLSEFRVSTDNENVADAASDVDTPGQHGRAYAIP